jgi:hypothetical protein
MNWRSTALAAIVVLTTAQFACAEADWDALLDKATRAMSDCFVDAMDPSAKRGLTKEQYAEALLTVCKKHIEVWTQAFWGLGKSKGWSDDETKEKIKITMEGSVMGMGEIYAVVPKGRTDKKRKN